MHPAYVDDVGTLLLTTILDQDSNPVNISNYLILRMFILKPNDDLIKKDCFLYTDGTDGQIGYVLEEGDFNIAGNYKYQAFVVIPQGVFYSDTSKFKVHPEITDG